MKEVIDVAVKPRSSNQRGSRFVIDPTNASVQSQSLLQTEGEERKGEELNR